MTRTCLFNGCESDVYLREMCNWHYRRVNRGDLAMPGPTVAQSTSWQERAACRGVNPELWFPVSERPDNPIVKRARAICANCPVVMPCAEWALNSPLSDGIFGGLTSIERRRIRQAAKAAHLESVGAQS